MIISVSHDARPSLGLPSPSADIFLFIFAFSRKKFPDLFTSPILKMSSCVGVCVGVDIK